MTWFGASAWIVTEPLPRGFGPKRGFRAKPTVAELRVLYKRHRDEGVAINQLGREVWALHGYATPEAAAVSIGAQFRRMHWPTRPQPVASSLRQRLSPTGVLIGRRHLHARKTPKRVAL